MTLHPIKLREAQPRWLEARELAGFPAPAEVWAHTAHKFATHVIPDWRGSVGLHGVAVARKKGFERIILAGVPMQAIAGHFVRKTPWNGCRSFTGGWETRKRELAPLRPLDERLDAQILGEPTLEMALGVKVSAAA